MFIQVEIKKVNLEVMRTWVADKVVQLLGFDDEVVIEFVMSLLESEVLGLT